MIKHTVIFGARGRIGSCVASKLYYGRVSLIDIDNFESAEKVLEDADRVINCMPHYMNSWMMNQLWKRPVDYFDLSEDIHYSRGFEWSKYPKKFVPHCGIAPGMINIMAAREMKRFDTVRSVKMRVGALARVTTNDFKYHCTWSPDGLINQYSNECFEIENYNIVKRQALTGLEKFEIDGVEYEAFRTSGGIGTMHESFAVGNVENMDYKSIRYPGHMKEILPFIRIAPERLRHLLDDGYDGEDRVIAMVMINGTMNGRERNRVVFREYLPDNDHSAIAVATTAGLIEAIEMAASNNSTGWISQEEL